jgi:hypothetical protein
VGRGQGVAGPEHRLGRRVPHERSRVLGWRQVNTEFAGYNLRILFIRGKVGSHLPKTLDLGISVECVHC